METLIVANWKMNPQTLAAAKQLFNVVKNWIKKHSHMGRWAGRSLENVRIIICPPFVYLESLSKLLKAKSHQLKIELGAQDCFWEGKGAFTGEISPRMLKNLGVKYVIIGHSKRRQILKETDEMINKKLKAALKTGLKPILCIGETFEERKKGKTFQVLKNQLKKDLKGLINSSTHQLINLIVAYEPVWAIGTGNPCKPEDAKEVLTFLKKITHQLINSSTLQLLYGGSVNSKNAKDYIEVGFDGLLVGGASLNPKEFVEIIKSCT
jgi:triosephosphate isomerase